MYIHRKTEHSLSSIAKCKCLFRRQTFFDYRPIFQIDTVIGLQFIIHIYIYRLKLYEKKKNKSQDSENDNKPGNVNVSCRNLRNPRSIPRTRPIRRPINPSLGQRKPARFV